MKIHRGLFLVSFFLCGAIALGGCDLQPKISSIPDSIGEFISERYPALLADPITEPEIYNSAVTDYGVYASPELYGSDKDYLVYADVDDYVAPQQNTDVKQSVPAKTPLPPEKNIHMEQQKEPDDYLSVPNYVAPKEHVAKEINPEQTDSDVVVVARGDTLYSIAKKHNTNVDELAKINSLHEPYTLSVGQKINIRRVSTPKEPKIQPAISVTPIIEKKIAKEQTLVAKNKPVKSEPAKPANPKRVAVQEITVAPGDTLYSLSRKYEIPVNDLAIMNKISSPFTLSVGQKLKVPKFDNQPAKITHKPETQTKKSDVPKNKNLVQQKTPAPAKESKKTKISSDPKKQLPQISARSSTKFSWPIRGKILSQYGAKNGGLFNDGINISGNMGTPVKAAENGVVAYAGNEVKGMGNLIIIQHSDGWMTVYAHLDSMSVRRGSKVSVGQQIGKIGKTGKVDKPQLHFEIRKGTKAYNPINYLKK